MKDANQESTDLTNKYCVCIKAWYIFFLSAVQKLLQTTSHTVDMFLHHHEHTHCSLFWLSPTYIVLLPQILTRVPNVDSSITETSPQQMYYFLLFE